MYPNRITAILQKENKYSKGISIIDDIMIPLAKGKYIALCEGDDYWTDENKLQKQYDFMEAHPECSLVCHNTIINDMGRNNSLVTFNDWKDIHSLTESDVFLGWKVHTSSYFFRNECYWVRDEY